MPVARSWVNGNTVYVYIQSDVGNWAIRSTKIGDILHVDQRLHIAAELNDAQVEELFGD